MAAMTEITTDLLLRAYAFGVFPMAERRTDKRLFWVDPDRRGVLPLDAMHVPRSLRKVIRSGRFEVRCDTDFQAVIAGCAEATDARPETWINRKIEALFVELHEMGFAHSVECWRDGRLAGGLYGASLGGAFFGESMFSRERDASKVALVHLAARLAHGGFRLLDTQFVTGHLMRFGAVEIPRDDYKERLAQAVRAPAVFYPELPPGALEGFLQSTTQTS
ncbi:MAG: leucyl/phenylalanyl-tRNA--protein transferase [Alphaproteobacteria bacterium]|nr:leucyl/phenylalanyl-tRNA--protein transferase [Alphaproteobacteria bacterium]